MSDHNIPGYTLDSLIGEGSCGLVYRATYQGQYPRCVKVFKAMAVNRQLLGQSLARMFREPPHEGIVDLYQFDLNHRPAYVATGFLGDNAPTLEDYVGRMEEDDAWLVLGKIADAAGYLHKFGVPHCGLKPSNILIDGSPDKPKLTDFTQGLLAGLHHMEIGDQPYYAAPEQIENPDGILDRRAQLWDVYAFGVVAYRLITGRFPRGDDFVRQIEQRAAAGAMLSLEPRDFAAVARSQPGIRYRRKRRTNGAPASARSPSNACRSSRWSAPLTCATQLAAFAKIEADREPRLGLGQSARRRAGEA
ncbi:MAG: protein kinase [Verrucomicrobiales bacterium]